MNNLELQKEQIRKLLELEQEVAEEHNKRNTSALPTTPEKLLTTDDSKQKDTKNIKCKSREIRLILETDSDLYVDLKELEELDPLFELNRSTLRKITESYIKDRLRKMKD
ncbi:TPA: hypothetical protein ACKTGI_002751 [Pseudomonas aeruginosa]